MKNRRKSKGELVVLVKAVTFFTDTDSYSCLNDYFSSKIVHTLEIDNSQIVVMVFTFWC